MCTDDADLRDSGWCDYTGEAKLESGVWATGEGSAFSLLLVFEQKGDSSAVANSCYKNEINKREVACASQSVPHSDICCL